MSDGFDDGMYHLGLDAEDTHTERLEAQVVGQKAEIETLKAREATLRTALAAATRERDEALAVLGECRGVLAGTPDSADESGNVRALLSRIDALTAKGEGR